MKNKNIANQLKFYRKENNLSVQEVADLLHDQNVDFADKTIYGWESGQTQPDADTLLRLCQIYHIDDILTTFGYESDSSQIQPTIFELELIRKYRSHPELHCAIKKLLELE